MAPRSRRVYTGVLVLHMFNVIVSHPWRGFSLCGGNGRRREGEKTPAEKLMTNDATEGSMGGISNRICLYIFFFIYVVG